MLPAASSVTPGSSLLPRTRGPIPERNRKLPTRLACGNAPTGSGARELSKDLLISSGTLTADYTDKHGFLSVIDEAQRCNGVCVKRRITKQALGTSTSTTLPAGNCPHDEEWLVALHDRIGQGSIRRFVRNVFAAGEEADERSALERVVFANGAAQHWVFVLQCSDHCM